MQYQPPTLEEALARALNNDFLIVLLISSQTKGKFKSLNLPFGLGKTSLSFWLSYYIHGGKSEDSQSDNPVWQEVRNDAFYYPSKLVRRLVPNVERKTPMACAVYDAVQMTAPADQNVPTVLRKLASYLSENRPECKVIIFNAPNINSISAPLRRLVAYELIVWERGHYEVQQIVYHKNFKNPLMDKIKLEYVEGTPSTSVFDSLPPFMQKWYDEWRAKEKEPYQRQLLKDLDRYEKIAREQEAIEPNEASDAGRAMARKRWR